MNKEYSKSNEVITLLILVSLLSFTRTIIHILIDKDLIDLDNKLGFNFGHIKNDLSTAFSILRILLISIILAKRNFKIDLISFVLIYLFLLSCLRIYYEYLYLYKPNSKEEYYIDKVLDITTIITFLSSGYIIYFIFFSQN
jgi:hypothetical protein